MEPRKQPEPNSVTNATVPGLELTKKMACSEAAPAREFELIGYVISSVAGDADIARRTDSPRAKQATRNGGLTLSSEIASRAMKATRSCEMRFLAA
jgi:hypothetical protein